MSETRRRLSVAILVVAIFILLVPPLSHVARAGPVIIHVRDYGTIRAAVDAANPGDTIIVDAGTYYGNVTITKSLTLEGVSASLSVIDDAGTGNGILINQTSGVSISQLTIKNPNDFSDEITVQASYNIAITGSTIMATRPNSASDGIGVINSSSVTIRGNTITGDTYGINVQGGFSNTIQTNVITGNSAAGIYVTGSQGNQFKNNLIGKSQAGLDLWDSSGGNTVSQNNITQNSLNGLWIRKSNGNLVVGNNIVDNNATGATGIFLDSSTGNRFYGNNIIRNIRQVLGVTAGDLTSNSWDNGAPSPRGNFWSDYNGLDDGTGGRVAGDGVGDTNIPWPCPNGNQPCSPQFGPAGVDYYPLMKPTSQPVLSVAVSAQPLSGCSVPSPLQVNFNGTAQGGSPPYTYIWSFGDGSVQTGQNQTTHSYTARGILFMTMTVNDSSVPNKSASDFLTIISFNGGLIVRVFDDAKSPVSGANVTSLSQPAGQNKLNQLSNSTGSVVFPCLPPGSYRVQVSLQGFVTLQRTITIANSTVSQSLTLVRIRSGFPFVLLEYAGLGAGLALVLVGVYVWRRSKRGRMDVAEKGIDAKNASSS